jgi:hypothetical protein
MVALAADGVAQSRHRRRGGARRGGHDCARGYPVKAQETVNDAEVMRLWRECGLPEYFLGNGNSNHKLVAFAEACAIELQSRRAKPASGFCWSCGATPRYQHKQHCRAGKSLRSIP